MKFSIILSLLILAVSALVGWAGHNQIVTARTTRQELFKQATALGINAKDALAGKNPRRTRHQRADSSQAARDFAAEFIAFARKMEAREQEGGGKPDSEMMKEVMALMDRMMSLNPDQLKIVIAEVRGAADLKDDTRRGITGFAIMTLATDHPQAALVIYTESADLLKDHGMGKHVVSSALGQWAGDDPLAAAKWVRDNGKKHPEVASDQAIRGLISGTASQDPALAFSLIGELEIEDSTDAIRGIARAAKTDADRDRFLTALRGHLGTLDEPGEKTNALIAGLSQLGSSLAEEGFDSATTWARTSDLSPPELEALANSVHPRNTGADTGRWIEWIGGSLPQEKADSRIRNLVSNWTREDYRAAGEWLAGTPDGPTKDASVKSYAETVAPYDPETAAQWALTLPPGNDRKATLTNIFQRWPDDDKEGAEAFARKHGLQH